MMDFINHLYSVYVIIQAMYQPSEAVRPTACMLPDNQESVSDTNTPSQLDPLSRRSKAKRRLHFESPEKRCDLC